MANILILMMARLCHSGEPLWGRSKLPDQSDPKSCYEMKTNMTRCTLTYSLVNMQ